MDTIEKWDDRRNIFIGSDTKKAIEFAVENWIHTAARAIHQRGRFAVALSGGSTPKAIYEAVTQKELDWSKVWLFWSDERTVPPDHPDSNYRMAMESGFGKLPFPNPKSFGCAQRRRSKKTQKITTKKSAVTSKSTSSTS